MIKPKRERGSAAGETQGEREREKMNKEGLEKKYLLSHSNFIYIRVKGLRDEENKTRKAGRVCQGASRFIKKYDRVKW